MFRGVHPFLAEARIDVRAPHCWELLQKAPDSPSSFEMPPSAAPQDEGLKRPSPHPEEPAEQASRRTRALCQVLHRSPLVIADLRFRLANVALRAIIPSVIPFYECRLIEVRHEKARTEEDQRRH